ncbi:GDSL esterase/lipase At4g01130 isoform X2 [Rhododendron vialii]|uniref:GDSL esterase/lipase At4g01130 isoform X2 n=1 Tax=Rhododendron vialii TaxID=182163 RepID=UPI00265E9475|nr:GDSL esterase/lipase At4g01130 isoform X2 [Rhododendron vialii]
MDIRPWKHYSATFRRVMMVAWMLFMAISGGRRLCDCKCAFEAIFNFGDSNSDTGGFYAAFPAESLPYGMTYFRKPVGRATDGRLMIDFLAQAIGLPFLSPYLQSIGSDYKHGANFATLASTVLLPKTSLFVTGVSPFSLAIQLNQMKQFKSKVDESHTKGGRTFLVLNLAPVGCYPAFLVELPHNRSDLDAFGCMVSYNNAVVDYNNMLKAALTQTRQAIPDASVIYVDTHAVLLELFQHPIPHGLKYGTRACCGYGANAYNFDPKVYCGNTKVINGSTLTATACGDPYNYVSWDGIHATEAANKLTANAILNGSYFDPPFPLHQICDLQPLV